MSQGVFSLSDMVIQQLDHEVRYYCFEWQFLDQILTDKAVDQVFPCILNTVEWHGKPMEYKYQNQSETPKNLTFIKTSGSRLGRVSPRSVPLID